MAAPPEVGAPIARHRTSRRSVAGLSRRKPDRRAHQVMNSPRAISDEEVVVADHVRTLCVPVWFRVASFPDRTAGNPHLDLFFSGLGAHGIALTGRFEPHP